MWVLAQWLLPEPGRPTINNNCQKNKLLKSYWHHNTSGGPLVKVSYLTLCVRRRSKGGAHQLSRRKRYQWCKACRSRVPGRSWGVQMEADRTAFTEDMRKERTAPQRRAFQRKCHTHATTILLENDVNSICGERLPNRHLRLNTSLLPTLDSIVTTEMIQCVTHSVTANNVPYGEGFPKFLLHPTRDFYTMSFICKWNFINTWDKTNDNPE